MVYTDNVRQTIILFHIHGLGQEGIVMIIYWVYQHKATNHLLGNACYLGLIGNASINQPLYKLLKWVPFCILRRAVYALSLYYWMFL